MVCSKRVYEYSHKHGHVRSADDGFRAFAEGRANAGAVFGFMGTAFLMVFLLMAIAVTYSVFAYLAYYDLFKSCKPDNAVLFLVLSIFVNVTLPFFIFACRKADEGMPPKIRSNV